MPSTSYLEVLAFSQPETLFSLTSFSLCYLCRDAFLWASYPLIAEPLFHPSSSLFLNPVLLFLGSEVKVSACNAGDLGSIRGLGRSPGEGNGNPLQYSCLENPMNGGAWWAVVHGVAKSRTQLSDFTFIFTSFKRCYKLYSWFESSKFGVIERLEQIIAHTQKKQLKMNIKYSIL